MSSKKEPPPVDEREWESQERGMRAARDDGADTVDAVAKSYRRVAMALSSAPRCEPPPDFATAVVAQIANRDAGVERVLFRGLVLALTAASVIVTALYAGRWWQALQEGMLEVGALQWVVAGMGCVALSWMMGQLQQFRPDK